MNQSLQSCEENFAVVELGSEEAQQARCDLLTLFDGREMPLTVAW